MTKATHRPECSTKCEYAQRRIPHHHTDWGACMVEFRRATLDDKAIWDEMGVPEVTHRKYVSATREANIATQVAELEETK